MKRSVNIWNHLDKVTVLLFLVMIIMGWFNIYAAVYNEEHKEILDLSQRYGKQFIWIIATIILSIFILIIDSRFYLFFAWVIYAIVILMLILVLVLGTEINGARSWFEFGPLGLQPSEFAKFATALALAAFLSRRNIDLTHFSDFLQASGIILLPAFLTALQPDMGSTIVFLAFYLVLFREGMSPFIFVSGLLIVILFFLTLLINNLYLQLALILGAFILAYFATRKWKLCLAGFGIMALTGGVIFILDRFLLKSLGNDLVIIITVILSGLVFAYYIYLKKAMGILIIYLFLLGGIIYINSVDYGFNHILKPHQKERVEIMLGFKSDPHGTGYNVNQSIISIGSGGFTGKGYLQGTQTKFKFVPSQSTDFIFCTVGEEWGFLGSAFVIMIYLFFLIRLVRLAERQRAVFTRIYGYGVISILFMHFFINIGMAIGLIPVIGIPLPFFSYGGSSLWGFTILLFIFLRLDASRTEYLV
ncbi:MAG TPA: rod shape-determining protein RodA [Bacteroidales bacterium]|nr:FtsW/RodA/SpoVE family cell cycle protein [Bacteroidales bacterium]OQB63327.1 MAG: Rod shape-determining protein RodA [Bacteroidetes bacterium ADurb.Bin145]HOU01759.1 rod shape-determining protein RodA [Bacteroidales bacterium]HQG62767.1 rod shape-determining protein RodA [Bacteroidales bacterium]HQK68166.1 rod shape-determining protein RodA [Bacteroidales bacterium]